MTDETQDAGNLQAVGYKNPPKKTQFVKGDKRINRKGRPRSFDELRKLAQIIAAEPISESEKMTRIEALLRVMSSSRNPADRKTFLEYAFGKVQDRVDLTSGGEALKNTNENEVYERVLARIEGRMATGESTGAKKDTAKSD